MNYFTAALAGILFSTISFTQLNKKQIEKPEGVYTYCYHKNGKIATEEFRNTAPDYMAQGYAKAYDNLGNEIYFQNTSRTGMLSSVHFSYYDHGAVRVAEYSSHPDAGIQWYRKITYFDENGKITGESEMSHDMQVTLIQMPDTAYLRLEQEREMLEKKKQEDALKEKREAFVKDSTLFFTASKTTGDDGVTIELVPDPINGTRQQIMRKSGRIIQITTEYFIKTEGIQKITRTYYKNGRMDEEFIYEAQIWHYRKFDKKGNVLVEKLNQSIAHTQ